MLGLKLLVGAEEEGPVQRMPKGEDLLQGKLQLEFQLSSDRYEKAEYNDENNPRETLLFANILYTCNALYLYPVPQTQWDCFCPQ